MKKRYIIFTIIALYIVLVIVATVYVRKEANEPEPTPEPTATATESVTPTPTPTATTYVSNCEKDKSNIQAALDAYYAANGDWPTANGQPGDIMWDKLMPDYMSELPVIDSSCDWRVNSDPEGQVCVAHAC